MLTEHFWLLCGAWVGGLSFVFGKIESKPLIAAGEYSASEVNSYLKGFCLAFIIPSLVFWGLQQSISEPVGADFYSWPSPQFYVAITVLVGLWCSLLVWTLFFSGSIWLSRCLRLIGNFPKFMLSPLAIKILVILVVLSGVSSILFGRI